MLPIQGHETEHRESTPTGITRHTRKHRMKTSQLEYIINNNNNNDNINKHKTLGHQQIIPES